jgi:hypothetical protein
LIYHSDVFNKSFEEVLSIGIIHCDISSSISRDERSLKKMTLEPQKHTETTHTPSIVISTVKAKINTSIRIDSITPETLVSLYP